MSTMFKAVVWKELRANLKWAVVVLLGMAAALTYAIPSVEELLRGQGVDLNGIFNALDATTAIGGILAGLLIGAAQTLVENRGDKWGFLAHRPISRTTLFRGKATAGILLYTISTGVPVAVALLRIAAPEYLPVPFDWRIALPAIANLLGGMVFYFAGILTGMRDARWYTSRALGIGAAICCIILQGVFAVEFWQAVAACAAGLIIVGTAAWSTFVAGGQYGLQPRIGRIATGVSIGLGMTLAGFIVLGVIFNALPEYETPQDFRYTSYAVTGDGAVVKVTRANNGILEVTDPGGHPLERYRNYAPGQPLSAGVLAVTLSPVLRVPTSFRSTSHLFSQLVRATPRNPVGWYYVHRLGLIAAYDSRSGKLVGWMGPDGFSPGDSKPRAFAGRMIRWSSSLLVFEDAVYRMDVDKQSVEELFESEPAEMILDAGLSQYNASAIADIREMAQFQVISTQRRVIVQLRDGTRLLEVPQDAKARKYAVLQVYRALRAPGAPIFLWYQSSSNEDTHISEFNSAGAVVNSWTLPTTIAWGKSLPRIAMTAALFPVTGQPFFEFGGQVRRLNSSLPTTSGTASWAVAILSSLVSAVAAFLHGRKYAFPTGRLSTWTGIALLLGPIGYLLMLALIEWPARESCPACSRKRVVTRERCEHCDEPFAAPPKDGTEIFEPGSYRQ